MWLCSRNNDFDLKHVVFLSNLLSIIYFYFLNIFLKIIQRFFLSLILSLSLSLSLSFSHSLSLSLSLALPIHLVCLAFIQATAIRNTSFYLLWPICISSNKIKARHGTHLFFLFDVTYWIYLVNIIFWYLLLFSDPWQKEDGSARKKYTNKINK